MIISYAQIEKLFAFDTCRAYCVEIEFRLEGSEKFVGCWMGKMWSEEGRRDVYWYGLTQDSQNACDYPSFEEMACAPVFDGESLKQVWNRVVIESIDGFDPERRLENYIGESGSRLHTGAPMQTLPKETEYA